MCHGQDVHVTEPSGPDSTNYFNNDDANFVLDGTVIDSNTTYLTVARSAGWAYYTNTAADRASLGPDFSQTIYQIGLGVSPVVNLPDPDGNYILKSANWSSADNVTFNNSGTVTVNGSTTSYPLPSSANLDYFIPGNTNTNSTIVNSVTLIGDSSLTNGSLYFNGGTRTFLTNQSGNNTISSNIIVNISGNGLIATMNINDRLTVGNITLQDLQGNQGYGTLRKDGLGVLDVTGTLTEGRPQPALQVWAGTLILSGTGNKISGVGSPSTASNTAINVQRYATLAGNASVNVESACTVNIYGHLAPGHNGSPAASVTDDTATFGALGTFSLTTATRTTTFFAGSFLDLDLLYPDVNPDGSNNTDVDSSTGLKHDTFALGVSNTLNIYSGAGIEINPFGNDPLAEGTYHIITIGANGVINYVDASGTSSLASLVGSDGYLPTDLFVLGDVPDQTVYEYNYQLSSTGGLDLVVTKIQTPGPTAPEPASLGLLGLGCGLMLLRRKHRS
ncbi:MAG: PEP-CTERM sorting domain-containing protein [Phycisphaerales bacterium]|nr:PEP-CTERM sorting domain-containing protein [Phycisphaerales bacterium]